MKGSFSIRVNDGDMEVSASLEEVSPLDKLLLIDAVAQGLNLKMLDVSIYQSAKEIGLIDAMKSSQVSIDPSIIEAAKRKRKE